MFITGLLIYLAIGAAMLHMLSIIVTVRDPDTGELRKYQTFFAQIALLFVWPIIFFVN